MTTRLNNPSMAGVSARFAAFVLILCLVIAGCSKDDSGTLRTEQFPLAPVGANGISGTIYISENLDSSFNVTIKLNRSVRDSIHVMNIYNAAASSPGTVSVKLSDIPGTGGPVIGETKNIRQIIETTGNYGSTSYDKVISEAKIVRVFLSANSSDSLLAEGFIGR